MCLTPVSVAMLLQCVSSLIVVIFQRAWRPLLIVLLDYKECR